MFAGAGTKVHDVVRGHDGVGVVFDDEERVAEVAQAFEDFDQAVGIARVQANGRLVEDVERADQAGAERSGKLDALGLTAGKRGGETVERKVIEPDFVEEAQALLNFFQDFFGDRGFEFGEFQSVEEGPRFLHGHLTDCGDGASGDFHGAGFGAQAGAVAVGASGVTAVAAEKNADVQFVFFALEPVEKTFDAFVAFFFVAVENGVALGDGQVAVGDVNGNPLGACEFAHFDGQLAVARLSPRFDRAIGERFAFVGDDAVEIEIDGVAETLAARAGAVRIVERKQARLRLLVDRAAFFAFEALVENHALRFFVWSIRNEFQDGFAAAFAVANFDGVHQARADFWRERETVDQHINRLGEIHVEQIFRRGEFENTAGLVEAIEAALAQADQRFADGVLRQANWFAGARGVGSVSCVGRCWVRRKF